jgi:hypothetical protein
MEVRLDPAAKTVAGEERISYRNPSQDTLGELWLRLYLKAFSAPDTTWMRESGGQHRGQELDPEELGDITVDTLKLADGADLLASATVTDTLMRVPLPQPLAPGQSIELDVSWTSKLPRVFARTGYGGRNNSFFMVGQWYPKMAVYDRGRWDTEPWHANAEFFHDFGSYDVTISTPAEYVVAGVGLPQGDAIAQDGLQTLRYKASDVTDFAFAASPDFEIETAKAGDVEIVLYYLSEHQSVVDEYIDSATESLRAFSEWFGAYPHPRLTVVDVPDRAAGAGGMEYPTLVTVGTLGMPSSSGIVALVTAHEIAHQWWPMQTATHEGREPWLDEGLAEYSGVRYMAEAGRTIGLFGMKLDAESLERAQYDGAELTSMLPAWEYSDNDYAVGVYFKPAMGLWTLEGVVGSARFHQAMSSYVADYRFQHPTGAEFRQSLERSLGGQSWFFDDYMVDGEVIEYVAGPIETSARGSTVKVRRVGGVRVPVEILITFADGTTRLETWDGQNASFVFPASQPVRQVDVDPEGKLKAEMVRSNNSVSADR